MRKDNLAGEQLIGWLVEWEEPRQEVEWRNDDVMGKPKDSPPRL